MPRSGLLALLLLGPFGLLHGSDPAALLWDATRAGRSADVERLLAAKADPNQRDEHGMTPLLFAAERGDEATVSALVAAGASIGARVPANDPHGRSALGAACDRGHDRIVQRLLSLGADPYAREGDGPDACIHAAAGGGHTRIVGILTDRKVPADLRAGSGETALMRAAYSGHVAVMRLLRTAGAAVNARSSRGMTALANAVMGRQTEAVDWLLSEGADANLPAGTAGSQWTPLFSAVRIGHVEIVRLLLQHQANPRIVVRNCVRDSAGKRIPCTARSLALHAGHDAIARILAEAEQARP